MYETDTDRFQFMRDCVEATEGIVLNVGCHVDGAGLRASWPDRVKNCDVRMQPGYDYPVDLLFDVRDRWPVDPTSVGLVVLGDILEHLYDYEITACLAEARRVSERVCITVPHDVLLADEIDPAADYKAHCNTIDEAKIRYHLNDCGWEIEQFYVVQYNYEVSSEGYLILAA